MVSGICLSLSRWVLLTIRVLFGLVTVFNGEVTGLSGALSRVVYVRRLLVFWMCCRWVRSGDGFLVQRKLLVMTFGPTDRIGVGVLDRI